MSSTLHSWREVTPGLWPMSVSTEKSSGPRKSKGLTLSTIEAITVSAARRAL